MTLHEEVKRIEEKVAVAKQLATNLLDYIEEDNEHESIALYAEGPDAVEIKEQCERILGVGCVSMSDKVHQVAREIIDDVFKHTEEKMDSSVYQREREVISDVQRKERWDKIERCAKEVVNEWDMSAVTSSSVKLISLVNNLRDAIYGGVIK